MNTQSTVIRLVLAATASLAAATALAADPSAGTPGSIERGRYLARTAGCNDCHTAGYAASGGNVAEREWLKGDHLGWSGPWGTTYPANLRLSMSKMSEKEWVAFARTSKMRPPMPWFALRDMSEDDLRALYRFVRHLGTAGNAAPSYVPPGQPVRGPVVKFPD